MSILPPRLCSPFAADSRAEWEAAPSPEAAKRVAGREAMEAQETLAYGLSNPRKEEDGFEECKWAAAAARRAQVWAAIAGDGHLAAFSRDLEARASRGMQSAQTGGGQ
jgi:hypothetical protein